MLDLQQRDSRVDGLELVLYDRHTTSSNNLLFGNKIILDGTPCIAGYDNLENSQLARQLLPEASREAPVNTSEQVFEQHDSDYRQVFQISLPAAPPFGTTVRLHLKPDGNPQRLVGVLADISAQLLREQHEATSEEKFFSPCSGRSPTLSAYCRFLTPPLSTPTPASTKPSARAPEETIGHAFTLIADDNQKHQLQRQSHGDGRVDNVEVRVLIRDGRSLTCLFSCRNLLID